MFTFTNETTQQQKLENYTLNSHYYDATSYALYSV